jgi:hypothetical protein
MRCAVSHSTVTWSTEACASRALELFQKALKLAPNEARMAWENVVRASEAFSECFGSFCALRNTSMHWNHTGTYTQAY